jgi:hypothetical protein
LEAAEVGTDWEQAVRSAVWLVGEDDVVPALLNFHRALARRYVSRYSRPVEAVAPELDRSTFVAVERIG